jgi:hypothetical protein
VLQAGQAPLLVSSMIGEFSVCLFLGSCELAEGAMV